MRDPRIDPRPGDVVRTTTGIRTVVPRWEDSFGVCFSYRNGYDVSQTIERWRSECAAAEVVTVAGEVTT